ncbi:MAG: putative sulfate/molybdate transporter [Armatimonadetes bacterium]|nr:putative sulfate/molybdate transporter [Armatimonadota bacterium]
MNKKLSLAFREVTGSLADLGTLLPLMLGLIACNGIGAGPTLVLVGVTYIAVGAYYRLPVPVQPMKALAMIAITTGASTGQIRASAYWMAAILLILGLTRVSNRLSHVFPRLLIHVLQLNLGIMMIRTGVKLVLSYPATIGAVAPGAGHAAGHAIAAGFLPSMFDFRSALVLLVIPQLPLTIGNAMLATSDCAVKYFGSKSGRVTPARLAISMGIANMASAVFGGMPVCHGAGGMTAHYRLGARTGAACAIIGSVLFVIGVLKGSSATAMLSQMPAALFGVLLAYVGIRHAFLAAESFMTPATAVVLVSSGIAGWFSGNLLIPLGVGFVMKLFLLDLRRARREAAGLEP